MKTKKESMEEAKEFTRGFLGVWIPKEIYLNEELSWTEKILLTEITNSSTLNNKYLAKFLRAKEQTIATMITKLKNLGYIK